MLLARTGTIAAAVVALVVGAKAPGAAAGDRPRTHAKARTTYVVPRGHTVIAVARRRATPVYARRGAGLPVRVLGRGLHGAKRVFLVDWQRRAWSSPRWVRVHLPVRPNGSRGWVRARDVRFLVDSYAIEVDLTRRELTLKRSSRVVMRAPIGVGRDVWPTPAGRYYLTELIKPPDPGGAYGPYAFGTSAYSSVLTRFGGGAGQVGIHGTNQPWLIGKAISHGCIRLDNRVIVRLAKTVPIGTPVRIFRKQPRALPSVRPTATKAQTRPPVRPNTGSSTLAQPRLSLPDVLALARAFGLERFGAIVIVARGLLGLEPVERVWNRVAGPPGASRTR